MSTDKNDQGSTKAGTTRLPVGSEAFPAIVASIAESAAAFIFAADEKGRILYANPHCMQVCGTGEDELLNRTIFDVFDLTDQQKAVVTQALKNRQPQNLIAALTGNDDQIYPLRIVISPLSDTSTSGVGIVAVHHPEGELSSTVSQLEKQLRQAQKMEAIGTLAGGIAHDFNNLLMGIQGNTALSLLEIDPGSVIAENLQKIEQYIKSGVDLTRQLLGYARGGKYEVNLVDLNELLDEQTRLFARTNKEIVFRTEYAPQLWAAEVDPGQIEQVILNLYMNALQAMPNGGTITIRTQNQVVDKEQFVPYQIKAGNYIKITVADSGVGMDEKTRQRIFDPFFTTREMGRGTGLGLASVYGIIKNHDGFINVASQKGRGTRFDICLPASQKSVTKKEKPVGNLKSGKETVLLVDDEDMIIDVGKRMLQKLGYHVLIAGDGARALEIYQENRQRIDIVILDMVMPNMNGGEAFDKIKAINPDVTVLLSSGYSIDGQASEILSRGCSGFIQKPFNLQALSEALRDVLKS